MILIIIGGRDFKDFNHVVKTLDFMKIEKIIHNDQNGAAFLAKRYAEQNNIPTKVYKADKELHGRQADKIRDEKMIRDNREATVIAFKGGKSTKHCLEVALECSMMRIF